MQERKKLIFKFVEEFLSNHKEIEEELCRQMGRPLSQCAGEMRGFEERAKYMIDNADKALQKKSKQELILFKSFKQNIKRHNDISRK